MKDWLEEIIDQLALGAYLANSKLSCGQRFGLIAVDNSVEFMLIAYVEIHRQLVGGHKPGGFTKKDWDDIKRKFPELLAKVVALEPALQSLELEISRYHEFRNGLYHSGIPVTTSPRRVSKYADIAKQAMSQLFGILLSPEEWEVISSQVASALGGDTSVTSMKRQVTYEIVDGLVKFSTPGSPAAFEAVALCLHGFSVVTSAAPSRPSLIQSLARSSHPLAADVVSARLHDLKKSGWLQKEDLVLSAKGRKELGKKYLI